MLIADDERRGVTANFSACNVLGVPLAEVPWHTIDDFMPPARREGLEGQWQEFLASGAAEGWYQLSVAGRTPVAVEFSATASVLPGRHLAVFMALDDSSAAAPGSALAAEARWAPIPEEDRVHGVLTQREREVLTLVASGLQSDMMAERLFVSPETIKSHVHNAMAKLGVHTRAHAVAVALVTGQITWELGDEYSTPPDRAIGLPRRS